MAEDYFLGVFFVIVAGVIASSGNILQKKSVNDIPKENRDENFMRTLIKSPTWIIGSIMCYVISSIFIILGQYSIGPALIPGLYASGLIVLAIGSVKLIGEKLKLSEIAGIVIIILGVALLGISELDIPAEEIETLDSNLILRIAIFSIVLFILWIINTTLAKKDIKQKGMVLAIAGGYQFILSNVWMFCLLVSMRFLFEGTIGITYILTFVVSLIIIAFNNYFGIKQTQEAYKYAQASIVQPTQEVPKQISAVFIYFLVFLRTAPEYSLAFIIIGSALMIVSGFLLGRRQAELDAID